MIWEKTEECRGPYFPLLSTFLMPERNSPTWRKAQLSSSADGASRFFSKWRLRITMSFWHAELADPGTVLHENVSFGFDVGYSATVVWHGFICWIGILGTFQTLNDFWHIWSISVRHCILEKIFPIFSFGSLYSLDGITANATKETNQDVRCLLRIKKTIKTGKNW